MKMNRLTRWAVAVACVALVGGGWQPLSAVDKEYEECSSAKTLTDKLVLALSSTAAPSATQGGTFTVRRTPADANENATRFEISYAVSGKDLATASLTKGSPEWDEFAYLELKASGGNLTVEWSSGGSGCCQCGYTVAATPRGFASTHDGTYPSYGAALVDK